MSRIDSHITIAERLLRGLVILSGSGQTREIKGSRSSCKIHSAYQKDTGRRCLYCIKNRLAYNDHRTPVERTSHSEWVRTDARDQGIQIELQNPLSLNLQLTTLCKLGIKLQISRYSFNNASQYPGRDSENLNFINSLKSPLLNRMFGYG